MPGSAQGILGVVSPGTLGLPVHGWGMTLHPIVPPGQLFDTFSLMVEMGFSSGGVNFCPSIFLLSTAPIYHVTTQETTQQNCCRNSCLGGK